MPIIKWPIGRFERLKSLAAQELTSYEIEKALGVSRSAVCGKAMRNGIKLLGGARKLRLIRDADPKLVECKEVVHKVRKVVRKKKKQVQIRPPRPQPKLELADIGSPCNIFQLRRAHCRWPMWALTTPFEAKHFCGQHAANGSSYCAEHAAMVYVPLRPRTGAPFRLPSSASNR